MRARRKSTCSASGFTALRATVSTPCLRQPAPDLGLDRLPERLIRSVTVCRATFSASPPRSSSPISPASSDAISVSGDSARSTR